MRCDEGASELAPHGMGTGLLREEAGRLWTSVAAERKRFRQNVVWQSYSARREECHGAKKNFGVLKPPKVVVLVHFA